MFVPIVWLFSISLLVCELKLTDKHGTKNVRDLSALGVSITKEDVNKGGTEMGIFPGNAV